MDGTQFIVPTDGRLGFFVVGTYAQTVTFGIASLLTYSYLRRPRNDPWWVPSVVVLVCATTMNWLLTEEQEPVSPDSRRRYGDVSASGRISMSAYECLSVQQKKGEWNIPLIAVIIFVVNMQLTYSRVQQEESQYPFTCAYLPFGSVNVDRYSFYRSFHPRSLRSPGNLRKALEATVAGGICADILLVVTLCLSLYRARSGLRRTDSALTLFILYSVYNGLLPTCFGIATLISLLSRPNTNLYTPFYIQIGNLFLISLVSSLNHRKTVRSQIQRELDLNYDAFDMVPDSATSTPPPLATPSSDPASVSSQGRVTKAGDGRGRTSVEGDDSEEMDSQRHAFYRHSTTPREGVVVVRVLRRPSRGPGVRKLLYDNMLAHNDERSNRDEQPDDGGSATDAKK
ncbi:uncharacterized protein C8Q71DRAFT_727742 [Rhodofomes roseus]|uniref:DUF6534 domain-containing protein n=1 Tax=Rhodofomes roseus TaxID=34475 RepID=A0ABQ8K0N2_9APHY|nr:uncharacterized protein C8Q71DRAFT_727742 [Rhodofomes roseus]KAH9829975.1 hypothetical protein C8Q71DRAFT_727742 [Rhodofomes roseus]